MLAKYIIILLCCYVYAALSLSTFISNGLRAEFFELTDDEVPVLKVSLPDKEFIEMKKDIDILYNINTDNIFGELIKSLDTLLNQLKKINYTEEFPGIDFNELLPQLQVGEDGMPGFDVKEVFDGFDINPDHYDVNENLLSLLNKIYASNEEFRLVEVINKLRVLVDDDNEKILRLFGVNDGNGNNRNSNNSNKKSSSNNGNTSDSVGQVDIENPSDTLDQVDIENPSDTLDQVDIENPSDLIDLEFEGIEFDEIEEPIDQNFDDNKKLITKLNPEEIKHQDQKIDNEFKTKNATMVVEINGEQISFDKVTFSLGGKYSRYFAKPGFNLKIRGGKDLYGRKQFKLRSDINEPTFLRTKLISDMHNRMNLPSISANYAELYINDEYMGLFVVNDAFKESWIEYVYGEKNTSTLYKCELIRELTVENSEGCVNENKDIIDNSEWISFLSAIENAKTPSDLEDIFEIDHFLKEMALDYLLGSWDHITNRHNYYMYKQPNGKWIYLSQDFDHDFGQPIKPVGIPFTEYYEETLHIIDILILDESQRFEKALIEVVKDTFNPSILFPHIDELKKFIRPYVEKDKTPGSNGKYPGRLNQLTVVEEYSIEQWDAYSEFTTGMADSVVFGLKYWILMKYRSVCSIYNMECDPTYLDENYEYSIDEEVEFVIKDTKYEFLITNKKIDVDVSIPTETTTDIISIETFDPIETTTDIIFTETFNPIETTVDIFSTETSIPFEINTNIISTETSIPTETIDLIETTIDIISTETSIPTETIDPMETTIDIISTETSIPTETINLIETTIDIISTEAIDPMETTIDIITTEAIDPMETTINIISTETIDPTAITTTVISSETSIPTETNTVSEDVEDETTSVVGTTITKTITTSITKTTTIRTTSIPTTTQTQTSKRSYQCWSELKGYPCCSEGITKVYAKDDYGEWGYDFVKHAWCGLTPYEEPSSSSDECWSEAFGYPCCKGCEVYESDSYGTWGYESHKWCGIPSYCLNKM